jgi:glycosyltransferase involved in cell wall biosynthesis
MLYQYEQAAKMKKLRSDNSDFPNLSSYPVSEKPAGITIVIVSYRRMNALAELLQGLLAQELDDTKVEVIIANNSQKINLRASYFSRLGRLLKQFHQLRIINSSYNWGPGIRYAIATMAQYRTILFFDDDIYPTSPNFVRNMYKTYLKLSEEDILTCWADLWVEWDDSHLSTVSMGFSDQTINQLTEVDYCGTGICMFNKKILLNPEMLEILPEFQFADTAWFPWIPTILYGSRKFFFPAFGMLKFHKEKHKGALHMQKDYEIFIFKARKFMLEHGYLPVLSRLPQNKWVEGSAEYFASTNIKVVKRPW